MDIVHDTTMQGLGTTELWWTRNPSFYDGLTYTSILGLPIDAEFKYRFRFDHMTDEGYFILPDGMFYCPESFNLIDDP